LDDDGAFDDSGSSGVAVDDEGSTAAEDDAPAASASCSAFLRRNSLKRISACCVAVSFAGPDYEKNKVRKVKL